MDETYAHHLAAAARAEAEADCDRRLSRIRREHEQEIVDAVAAHRDALGTLQLRLQGRVDELVRVQGELGAVTAERDQFKAEIERLVEIAACDRREYEKHLQVTREMRDEAQAQVVSATEQIASLCERYEQDLESLRKERDAAVVERDRALDEFTSPRRDRREGDAA